MLDLGRLRVLRELQRRGTAGAVAEALGYSPSAVSQQLAQLQREVGVRLVEKAGRRLRLTPAGEALAARAQSLLDEARGAEEAALAASGGPVPLAALSGERWVTSHLGTNCADLLERACVDLAGFHPDVRYRTNDIMVMFAMVAHGGAVSVMPDLAFAEQQPGIVTRPLDGEPLRRRMVLWTRAGADVRPSVRALLDALRVSAGDLAGRRPGLARGPRVPAGS